MEQTITPRLHKVHLEHEGAKVDQHLVPHGKVLATRQCFGKSVCKHEVGAQVVDLNYTMVEQTLGVEVAHRDVLATMVVAMTSLTHENCGLVILEHIGSGLFVAQLFQDVTRPDYLG